MRRNTKENVQKDIARIKSSRIPFKTFIKVHNKYRLAKDAMLQHKFYEQASMAGIVFAMPYLAYDYCSGEGTVEKDYKKAAKWFEKAFSILHPESKLTLANLYINGMSEEHTEEDGQRLLEEVKSGYAEYNRSNQEYICTIIETEHDGMLWHETDFQKK